MSKKYGHLPEKKAEASPWEILCVDLIGPYTIKRKGKASLQLWCVTMIDPATGWFEMRELNDKKASTVSNEVELAWLTRYPWPTKVIYDRGTEFLAEFADMITNDYGIKKSPATVRNPQANAILERIHQTLGNIVRTFQVQDMDLDDPWSGILAATMFALRSTYHTTTQATAAQLVFGRDAILNVQFEADWHLIRARKQAEIARNNKRENARRIPHTYAVGDKVLKNADIDKSKFGTNPWEGPFTVTKINDNGTVRLKTGCITDTINIRQLKLYRE
jgi:hypothetical protein